ncbi:anti-sigma factor domain-containing protein [Lutispora sp.]|uniref:anti-sigma factor domain-containing protein n=1 Tax=Lutispora sp. TaxID=2828727 RepID=UPI002B2072E7|nr:anti-sigma factor domain-containing protein [Lutispora sp.]MEA4960707.1 anti-sigma factor domain-containing protein [Lutispora sp.]
MRKGVVIKLNRDRATLMAEDCTFCDIKAFKGMYQGMEICFNDVDILKRRLVFRANRYVNAACFMLLVFCSYLFLSFYQENIAAYAYVGIDINPSIELALNKKGIIIGSRGLDEEGKELLDKINIKKMDGVEGVKQIIAKTIDMNYLDKDDSNEITLYAIMEKENHQSGNELIEIMENAIKEEVVAHSIDGKINAFVSDKKVKDKADKMGVSVVQYISKDAKSDKSEDKGDKAPKDKSDKGDKASKGKSDKGDKAAKDKKEKDSNKNDNVKKNKPDNPEDNGKKYELNKNKEKDISKPKLEQKDKPNKQDNEKVKGSSNKDPKNKN